MPIAARCFVGSRLLYAEIHGASAPTVVIESGSTMAGTSDPGWRSFTEALAGECSVFLYDRAGLGRSDPFERPRPLSSFAADLRAVLQSARAAPPYLMVGCSLGGMIVTHYASLHPQEVCAVLLLDPPHPEINLRTLDILPLARPEEPPALAAFRQTAWQEQYEPLAAVDAEALDFPASIIEARACWNLGDIPLLILTAGVNAYEDGFPADAAAAYEAAWLDCQRAYAALSTRGEQRMVVDSTHVIHYEQPDLVLAEIRRLSIEACGGSSGR